MEVKINGMKFELGNNITKFDAIKAYVKEYLDGAHSEMYIFGSEVDGNIVMYDMSELVTKVEIGWSSGDNKHPSVKLRTGVKELRKHNGTILCTKEEFEKIKVENNDNNGQCFERLVWKFYGIDGYKHDNRDQWSNSDIESLKAQVKFYGGFFDMGSRHDYDNLYFRALGINC